MRSYQIDLIHTNGARENRRGFHNLDRTIARAEYLYGVVEDLDRIEIYSDGGRYLGKFTGTFIPEMTRA